MKPRRPLDRYFWLTLSGMLLAPVVLLALLAALLLVTAHVGPLVAFLGFFTAAMILGRTMQIVRDHRARGRYLRS